MEESDPYECPATFEAAGLGCALMTGHDNGWHWDERGVDWRENQGIEPTFGAVLMADGGRWADPVSAVADCH